MKFINEFRNEQKWITVLDGHLIELAVVLYWSEHAILFLDKEEGRCEQGLGRTDVSGFQVLIKELVELFLFISVQGVDLAV